MLRSRWALPLFLALLSHSIAPNAVACLFAELARFSGPRAIFVADRHTNTEGKNALIASFSDFRKQGVTHLALEMFDPISNRALQAYFNKRMSDEELFSELSRFWSWNREDYVALVRAARDAGIRLLGIDEREKSILGRQLTPHERDQFMVQHIGELITRDASTRVLVLVGRIHILPVPGSESVYPPGTPRLPELLFATHAIVSTVYSIADGKLDLIGNYPIDLD